MDTGLANRHKNYAAYIGLHFIKLEIENSTTPMIIKEFKPVMKSKLIAKVIHYFASIPHHYVKLILLLSIGIWSSIGVLFHFQDSGLEKSSYDDLIKRRIVTPKADPKIIVLDIDEKSLDVLKEDFGRWPWPRETLGGVLDWLESQGAKAIVFDILFADVDRLNTISDQAFSESVKSSSHSYFPILRLNPINDSLSEVSANDLIGFTKKIDPDAQNTTLAVIPPVFKSIIDTGRLGFHNIYPDADGVNRSYSLWEEKNGWRLWSLPARIGNDLGWQLPNQSNVLIRFEKDPYSHTSIPFHEIWKITQSKRSKDLDPRIKDAIVIIGSTATNLFDVKSTPISPIHPGVQVLANVIDNLKNNQFTFELPISIKLFMLWLALLVMGIASEKLPERLMKFSIFIIPSLFLFISYLSLNFGHIFIDLTLSATQALLFFSLVSVYLNWRSRYWSNFVPNGNFELCAGRNSYALSLALHMGEGYTNQQEIINAGVRFSSQIKIKQIQWSSDPAVRQPGIFVLLMIEHDQAQLIKQKDLILEKLKYMLKQVYVSRIFTLNREDQPSHRSGMIDHTNINQYNNFVMGNEYITLSEAFKFWSQIQNTEKLI